jgi:hypothetical protein
VARPTNHQFQSTVVGSASVPTGCPLRQTTGDQTPMTSDKKTGDHSSGYFLLVNRNYLLGAGYFLPGLFASNILISFNSKR